MSEGGVTVYKDSRDGNMYTVTKINGKLFMTENLRLAPGTTLTSQNSNISASSYTLPTTSLTSGNSYTEARSACSSNTTYGCYYNFCAASAGTVCQNTSKVDASYDICPKGWRFPTFSEMNNIHNYETEYAPIVSGYYNNGFTNERGVWWDATGASATDQYNVVYDGGSSFGNASFGNKSYGFSVRCIKS